MNEVRPQLDELKFSSLDGVCVESAEVTDTVVRVDARTAVGRPARDAGAGWALQHGFPSVYDLIGEQRVTSSNLYAAEPHAKDVTARFMADAGFDPVHVGDLESGARPLENNSGFTGAPAGQIGPFFHRYGRPTRWNSVRNSSGAIRSTSAAVITPDCRKITPTEMASCARLYCEIAVERGGDVLI